IADMPTPPVVVVPLGPGADEAVVRSLLASGRPDGPQKPSDDSFVVRKVRGAIFMGMPHVIERMKTAKATARPELAKSFAAVSGTAARALLLPSKDTRRVLEATMPMLPIPKEVGGPMPVRTLTDGVMWAAFGVNGPPKAKGRLVIQSRNPEAAKALAAEIRRVCKAVAAHPRVREFVPNVDMIAAALAPSAEGDRVTIAFDPEHIVLGAL
ncbi:MAG: hypothetical protein GY848_08220, partial [Methyloversatilis sp.]|nr:hypothetical protein [Methyloversatilis sp.]